MKFIFACFLVLKECYMQVPPAELEDILLSHPLVKDSAVIGIPDKNVSHVTSPTELIE